MKYLPLYEETFTLSEIDSNIDRLKRYILPLIKKYKIPKVVFDDIKKVQVGIETETMSNISVEAIPIFNKDNLKIYFANIKTPIFNNFLFDTSKILKNNIVDIGNIKKIEDFIKIFEELFISKVDSIIIGFYENKEITYKDVKEFAKLYYKDFPDHFIEFTAVFQDRHVGTYAKLVKPLYDGFLEIKDKVNKNRLYNGITEYLDDIQYFYEYLDDKTKEKYKSYYKGSDYDFFK